MINNKIKDDIIYFVPSLSLEFCYWLVLCSLIKITDIMSMFGNCNCLEQKLTAFLNLKEDRCKKRLRFQKKVITKWLEIIQSCLGSVKENDKVITLRSKYITSISSFQNKLPKTNLLLDWVLTIFQGKQSKGRNHLKLLRNV